MSSTDKPDRRRLIIDTDGGVDDAAAVWWALIDPRIELVGVTTVAGVVSAKAAADNVLQILHKAGRPDIPVAVGADARVGPVPALRPSTFIHGNDGLGDTGKRVNTGLQPIDKQAEELLYRLCSERPGEISVVSLGPLTNVAITLSCFPEWPHQVQEFIAMAGSAAAGGNALPAAEANVANDPIAAAIAVAAPWKVPPLMVGLDVTHVATLTDAEFELLAQQRTPAAAFLDAPLRFYRRFGSTFTGTRCPCHDLLAVMALAEPGIITGSPVLPLAIDTAEGPAWGTTVVDFRAPFFARIDGADQSRPAGFHPWRIALHVDAERFRRAVRKMFGDDA